MTLTVERKGEIQKKYGKSEADSGSTEVQVALLTERINSLTQHLRQHPKDNASRQGLIQMVSQRNRFLRYLARKNYEGYQRLIASLGLRK
jgi:small subunit ribosomal protein S15